MQFDCVCMKNECDIVTLKQRIDVCEKECYSCILKGEASNESFIDEQTGRCEINGDSNT